jgi:hypothetical protein
MRNPYTTDTTNNAKRTSFKTVQIQVGSTEARLAGATEDGLCALQGLFEQKDIPAQAGWGSGSCMGQFFTNEKLSHV